MILDPMGQLCARSGNLEATGHWHQVLHRFAQSHALHLISAAAAAAGELLVAGQRSLRRLLGDSAEGVRGPRVQWATIGDGRRKEVSVGPERLVVGHEIVALGLHGLGGGQG